VQIIREIDALRRAVAEIRGGGGRVALVPTMGALHAGHMALIAEAKRQASHVAASIFVNPTQFAPTEDLASYPRREAADAEMLEEAGCAILWAPSVATMYPDGHATSIRVTRVSDAFEGAHRPRHHVHRQKRLRVGKRHVVDRLEAGSPKLGARSLQHLVDITAIADRLRRLQ
jgi:pantoate--beta-alanine ligase